MKKWLFAAVLLALNTTAFAQIIPQFPFPGPALPNADGTKLNAMVNAINKLQGTSGSSTPSVINKNNTTGAVSTSLTGTDLQVLGADASVARIELDAFGGVPLVSVVRRDGTLAAPTAIQSADQLGSFNFHGSVSSTATYGPSSALRAYATETWTGTAGGSKIVFSTTPNTTQTLTDAVTIGQDQSLTVVGALVAPAATFSGLLRTTFGTPTIASGACGTTTNGVITSGTNQAGLVTIGAASTTTCTISFSATLANAPNACIVFPASAGAAATGTTVARVSSITTSQFVITGSALASTAYYYLCI